MTSGAPFGIVEHYEHAVVLGLKGLVMMAICVAYQVVKDTRVHDV